MSIPDFFNKKISISTKQVSEHETKSKKLNLGIMIFYKNENRILFTFDGDLYDSYIFDTSIIQLLPSKFTNKLENKDKENKDKANIILFKIFIDDNEFMIILDTNDQNKLYEKLKL